MAVQLRKIVGVECLGIILSTVPVAAKLLSKPALIRHNFLAFQSFSLAIALTFCFCGASRSIMPKALALALAFLEPVSQFRK